MLACCVCGVIVSGIADGCRWCLAAQHGEITRLRASVTAATGIPRLPQRTTTIGSCS